jgi:hypothetical protein
MEFLKNFLWGAPKPEPAELHTYTDRATNPPRGIITPGGGALPIRLDLFQHVKDFIDKPYTCNNVECKTAKTQRVTVETLGEGTFGSVYRFTPVIVTNPEEIPTPFCVKIFKQPLSITKVEEIRTSLSNATAHLADYTATIKSDVVTYRNKTFYVMELVEGHGSYRLGDFRRLLVILQRLEESKLTFVDWKPHNMGRKDGELVLIDLDAIYPLATGESHYSMLATAVGSYGQVPTETNILSRQFLESTKPKLSIATKPPPARPGGAGKAAKVSNSLALGRSIRPPTHTISEAKEYAKWAAADRNLVADKNQIGSYSTVAACALTMYTLVTGEYIDIQSLARRSHIGIAQNIKDGAWKRWKTDPNIWTGRERIIGGLENLRRQHEFLRLVTSADEQAAYQAIIDYLETAPQKIPRVAHLLSRF